MRRDFREENLCRPQDVLNVEGEGGMLAKVSRLLFAVGVVTAQWTGVAVIRHVAGMHSTQPVDVWWNLNFIFRVESIKKVPGDITQCNNENVLVCLHVVLIKVS